MLIFWTDRHTTILGAIQSFSISFPLIYLCAWLGTVNTYLSSYTYGNDVLIYAYILISMLNSSKMTVIITHCNYIYIYIYILFRQYLVSGPKKNFKWTFFKAGGPFPFKRLEQQYSWCSLVYLTLCHSKF